MLYAVNLALADAASENQVSQDDHTVVHEVMSVEVCEADFQDMTEAFD